MFYSYCVVRSFANFTKVFSFQPLTWDAERQEEEELGLWHHLAAGHPLEAPRPHPQEILLIELWAASLGPEEPMRSIWEYESACSVKQRMERQRQNTTTPRNETVYYKRSTNQLTTTFSATCSKIPKRKLFLVPTVRFQTSWSQLESVTHFCSKIYVFMSI